MTDWSEYRLEGQPQFFVGHRKTDKSVVARRISLHQSAMPPLVEIAQQAIEQLSNMDAVPYGPYSQPEHGEEYLLVERESNSAVYHSGLTDLCADISSIEILDAEEIAKFDVQFYGIAFDNPAQPITFIRKSNPKRSLNKGNRFFKFKDSLRLVPEPDVMLETDVDIVIATDYLAILKPFAFDTIAADVSFAKDQVVLYVKDVHESLLGSLPLGSEAVSVLEDLALRKVSIVKRLRNLKEHLTRTEMNELEFRDALQKHDLDVADWFTSEGEIVITSESVEQFLDLVEGRFYEQDFTHLPMRADRSRRR